MLIDASPDLEFTEAVGALEAGTELARSNSAGVLIVDKGFGMQAVLDWLHDLKLAEHAPATVVWGVSMTEAEALRLLQAGARGILRKSVNPDVLILCLRTVANGGTWMDEEVFRKSMRVDRSARTDLTPREHQVLELVEQGFKNKEIATELGIRPGTVKIHLKHIFEKTGVRGRYGLALTGLKEKGVVSISSQTAIAS